MPLIIYTDLLPLLCSTLPSSTSAVATALQLYLYPSIQIPNLLLLLLRHSLDILSILGELGLGIGNLLLQLLELLPLLLLDIVVLVGLLALGEGVALGGATAAGRTGRALGGTHGGHAEAACCLADAAGAQGAEGERHRFGLVVMVVVLLGKVSLGWWWWWWMQWVICIE